MRTRDVVAVAALLALAGPARAVEKDVVASAKLLRERGGICAGDLQGATLATFLQAIVCIGVGTPFTVSDSHEPWLYLEVQTDPQHVAAAQEWTISVTAPDGKRLMSARSLAKEKPLQPANPCAGPAGCRHSAVALKAPAWKPGKYLFHLVYQPDPEITADLSITLR